MTESEQSKRIGWRISKGAILLLIIFLAYQGGRYSPSAIAKPTAFSGPVYQGIKGPTHKGTPKCPRVNAGRLLVYPTPEHPVVAPSILKSPTIDGPFWLHCQYR